MTLECMVLMALCLPLVFAPTPPPASDSNQHAAVFEQPRVDVQPQPEPDEPDEPEEEKQEQAGDSKNDDNDYYSVDDCSNKPGSSGRPGESECESAQKETEQEKAYHGDDNDDNEEESYFTGEPDDPETAWHEGCRGICLD
jgi:hypothetical protein